MFVPADAGATVPQETRLQAILVAAARAGYPIRVAIIASQTDLGSVTAFWREPEDYANFLGEELSLVAHARVLVIMPNGFGLYVPRDTPQQEVAILADTKAPPASHSLTALAAGGVENLAAESGHPIPAASIHVDRVAQSASGGSSLAVWLTWALGALTILLTWAFSLRARPWRPVRRPAQV